MTKFFGKLRKSLFWTILGHLDHLLPHSWEKMNFLKKLISASFYILQLPNHHAKHQKTLMTGQQRKLQNDRQTDNQFPRTISLPRSKKFYLKIIDKVFFF